MNAENPWLMYAQDDYLAMEALAGKGPFRAVCFHAQQVVEKLLKAKLYDASLPIPKTHDLAVLAGLAKSPLPVADKDLQFLSSVYIESRYPPDLGLLQHGDPSQEDAERAAHIAKEVYVNLMP